MRTAPSMMKIARRTSAMMMPTISTSCWYRRGTANWLMSRTKTKRLSTDRLYSVSHPATNSPIASWLPVTHSSTTANTSASET